MRQRSDLTAALIPFAKRLSHDTHEIHFLQFFPEYGLLEGYGAPVDGISKLAFHVTDLDAFAAKLRSEGVRFQTGIMEAKGSWPRSFIVLDNDANWIQFVESTGISGR